VENVGLISLVLIFVQADERYPEFKHEKTQEALGVGLGTDKTHHVWAAEMAAMALGTVHLNILCME
jgi:hypothetical protein